MKKILLIVLTLSASISYAQNFLLTYNMAACSGNPLTGISPIYMYAGAGTQNSSSSYDYTAGTLAGNQLPLNYMGNNVWEICFNPYQIFRDANNVLMPGGTTIYNFEFNFRDSAGTIFAGQCGTGNYLQIDNPMTSPISLYPTVIQGSLNCSTGINETKDNDISINNFPNPVTNSNTVFEFNLSRPANVSIFVYDILGNKVASVIQNKNLSGSNHISWNVSNYNGQALKKGCYFYSLQINGKSVKCNKLIIAG